MRNITPLIEESKALANEVSTPESRLDQIRILASKFVESRLENTQGIEAAKGLAVNQLINQIPDIDSPTQLMRIIKSLNELTQPDLDILFNSGNTQAPGKRGENAPSNPFATIMGEGSSTVNTSGSAEIPREVYKLIDMIAEINETLDYHNENDIEDASIIQE